MTNCCGANEWRKCLRAVSRNLRRLCTFSKAALNFCFIIVIIIIIVIIVNTQVKEKEVRRCLVNTPVPLPKSRVARLPCCP